MSTYVDINCILYALLNFDSRSRGSHALPFLLPISSLEGNHGLAHPHRYNAARAAGTSRTVNPWRWCSFSADTPVATLEGSIPISELTVGAIVLGWDEGVDVTGGYTVTDVWVHTDPEIVHLTLDGDAIETTPEHPFYVEGEGWVPAGKLMVGDEIRRADGSVGVVNGVIIERYSQPMYNLTVEEAHTFFVGEGQWLVHNWCHKFGSNTLSKDPLGNHLGWVDDWKKGIK